MESLLNLLILPESFPLRFGKRLRQGLSNGVGALFALSQKEADYMVSDYDRSGMNAKKRLTKARPGAQIIEKNIIFLCIFSSLVAFYR